MARKVKIQPQLGAKGAAAAQANSSSPIDQLASTMSTVDVGFRPTDQRVYEVNLNRILPDFSQPRRILPYDLRQKLEDKTLSPLDAIQELIFRAENNDTFALLVLGRRKKDPEGQNISDDKSDDQAEKSDLDEKDDFIEDKGLFALAQSIREIGLRQPLNVYRIDDPNFPDQTSYRIGEGERRFWAHNLLVLQGHTEFNRAKCIVETLPDNEELIHQRQEAENAARVDLPAIARARSIRRIMDRLNVEMGTRVPGTNTIKLPTKRELEVAVGQQVKSFTGRAISDRMVRNYLGLLNLAADAQDLAEAGQLTEKQLRPVKKLSDAEQVDIVRRTIENSWSASQVQDALKAPTPRPEKSKKILREITQSSIEQQFEKRVMDAAKTVYSLTSMPQENYDDAVIGLAARANSDEKALQALQKLRDTLDDILVKWSNFSTSSPIEVTLLSILPPLQVLKDYLPTENFNYLEAEVLTGGQIFDQLNQWGQEDALLASRLEPFLAEVQIRSEALRAGEEMVLPTLIEQKSVQYPGQSVYKVSAGSLTYWAHELLVRQGEAQFKMMNAFVEYENLDQT